jgi:hypothetical protein
MTTTLGRSPEGYFLDSLRVEGTRHLNKVRCDDRSAARPERGAELLFFKLRR